MEVVVRLSKDQLQNFSATDKPNTITNVASEDAVVDIVLSDAS